ncbi:DNA helicase PcrA [Mediterraneibacter sp. NSJ-151]|uniref:DNA helicase PcrA n=1 Tax=Mediterraneibacter sp. NSJ-151 TaxID=2897708 RepID=UPI001F0B6B3F|nr:DNA helicase PcrA [Mediterraneibacter sp. NSJ-151]MCH4280327.1 DNA helicase PcrA [Mediterraneibacter sp. NSJ-151]
MSIYDTLNEQQREAVYHTEGPLLILAGAGSGKTRVLTHRIAYLIEEKGVNPWNILAITFTNKAAGEMRERVDNLVGFGSESIWVSTFHSTCVRILRRYIDRIGYDTNFTIYDSDDQKTLMRDICKQLNIDTKKFKERTFLGAISSAKDEMVTPAEYEVNAVGDFSKQMIAKVYWEYEKQLQANNALDFDDLLMKTVQLFQKDAEVLEYYQNRFRYIMVDEYQDTNTVQFKFVSLLAAKYQNLCVVGDDDQSIYKFRGANIQNILSFEEKFKDAKVIKLEQNYRSTGNILNAANAVIRNNHGRKDKSLWTEKGDGEKIQLHEFDTAYDEAEFIVNQIKSGCAKGNHYNDYAILYRTNAQSRIFEEKFVANNIPYKIIGGVNFYARREIKDLLSYLKTIDNARDDLAVRRIINVPKRGIGLTTVNRVQDSAQMRGIGFYEALQGLDLIPGIGRSAAKLDSFVALIEYFKGRLGKISLTDLLKEIIEMTAYVESLEAEDKEDAQARIENIDELLNKVATYEEVCAAEQKEVSLSGFLEEVALVADIDNLDEEQDYVVLMTLHSAKGLEFPNVYLAGMEDGLFPSYMCIDNPEDLEEERRLCYVGITRAEQELVLSCARMRMVRGETHYNRVSRFVKEIPEDLLEKEEKLFSVKEEKDSAVQTAFKQAKQAFAQKPFTTYASPLMTGAKQFAVTKEKGLDYTIGDRVRHIKFGVGTVKDIVEGGRDYEVTVEFDTAGVKKMFATFAKLKKEE